jgi:UPF0716 family protein affecting phage T7 exclusion
VHTVFSTLFVFVFLFFLDLWLLVRLGGLVGWHAVVAWLGVTFVFGYSLVGPTRPRGSSRISSPWALLARHAAGIFLMLPGILSDLLGVCLLLPPLRAQMGRWILKGRPEAEAWNVLFRSAGKGYDADPPRPDAPEDPGPMDPGSPQPQEPPRQVRDAEFEMLQEDTNSEEKG